MGTTEHSTTTQQHLKHTTMAHQQLLADLEKVARLKDVETVDKSAPVIDGDVQVKTVDRSAHLAALASEHELKHAETEDKSAPKLPKAVTEADRNAIFSSLAEGVELKKAETVDNSAHLAAIASEHELKHAETVDKSAPAIPADVTVGKNPHQALLAEIKKADE